MVYLDGLLVLEWVVDYLLLVSAARLDGDLCRRGRCALAAALGAVYSGLTWVPGLSFLGHPVGQAAAAVAMILTAFGRSDRTVRTGGIFLLLACAFGGGLLLLGRGLGFRSLLVAAALGYGGLCLVLRGEFTHPPGQVGGSPSPGTDRPSPSGPWQTRATPCGTPLPAAPWWSSRGWPCGPFCRRDWTLRR